MRRLFVASLLLVSAAAHAQDAAAPQDAVAPQNAVAAPAPKRDRGQLLLAVEIGALLPYGFSRLGASYLVDLQVGWALPWLKHRLALALDGGFTAPEASGTTNDPRLDASGGSYSWRLSQRELILGLTIVYRHPIGRLTPYAGVGPRLFLLDSRVQGSAGGAIISQSSETSTKIGVGIPVGLGVRLGPGDLFGELALNISAIDHRTTGDTNTGSFTLAAGYRFLF